MRVRIAAVVAAVAMVAAACTESDGGSDPSGNSPGGAGDPGGGGDPFTDEIMLASSLTQFNACDDLLDYVVEHGQDLVGPYGLGGGFGVTADVAEAESADDALSAEAPAAAADGAGFSAGERAAVPLEGGGLLRHERAGGRRRRAGHRQDRR
jgi:hypothetical protein